MENNATVQLASDIADGTYWQDWRKGVAKLVSNFVVATLNARLVEQPITAEAIGYISGQMTDLVFSGLQYYGKISPSK